MSKVTIKATGATRRIINNLKKSDEVAEQLEPFARAVLEAASQDTNDAYVESLRIRRFVSRGPQGRVSWQVGAVSGLGDRVEAKRGTLQRALGEAGL